MALKNIYGHLLFDINLLLKNPFHFVKELFEVNKHKVVISG
jgi:hypothetical protein